MNGQPRSASVLSGALQALGALAGLATLTALVGGAILWIRFDALGLPADNVLALLPERLLVTVGVHALVAPVLVGLGVALTIVLIDPLRSCDGKPRKRLLFVWILIVVGGAIALYLGVEQLDFKYQLPMYAIGIFAIAVLVLSARARQTRGRHVAMITFAAFALCGSALAVLRTAGRPMMEPLAALLKDGRGLSGFHIASTADHIYVATLAGEGDPDDPFADAPIDRVIEIPRSEVVRRAARRPTTVGPDGGGRDEAQTLLLDLRARYALGASARQACLTSSRRSRTRRSRRSSSTCPRPPVTRDPVGDLAPLLNLHSHERFWPTSTGAFLRQSTLYWRHAGKCSAWRAVDRSHVKKLSATPDKVAPKVDPRRLGVLAARLKTPIAPYTHTPSGASCRDVQKPVVSATQTSRPFEGGERIQGLPVDEGFFLDAASAVRAGTGRRRKNGSQVLFDRVPVYFEQNPEGEGRKRITYWLFYGYSLPPGPEPLLERFAHEGDWERVSVLVARVKGRQRRWRPISVRYYFHDESRDVPWSAVRLTADETQVAKRLPPTHPVAYIARNSHATYPRAGRSEGRKRVANRTVSAFDEAIACADCPQWRSWHALRNAKRQYWYGFGGAWGLAGRDGSRTGPLGPSARKSLVQSEPSLKEEIKLRDLPSDQ